MCQALTFVGLLQLLDSSQPVFWCYYLSGKTVLALIIRGDHSKCLPYTCYGLNSSLPPLWHNTICLAIIPN
ncbi:hypothetical protein TSAR_014563 [Trichomalopsis sarcophagae]|uniref:Uncharacterized protein n=1 Tax=Trichomalopsis sarcophagae TaxID=543379 RepID=A0A232ERU3_9HYME|nr:hypothetical protein TSAR_014563 [Trichomalopsis sarcophagae]